MKLMTNYIYDKFIIGERQIKTEHLSHKTFKSLTRKKNKDINYPNLITNKAI